MTMDPLAALRPALSLYEGTVMHARMRPVAHRFSYRVASILIDIDRLDEADAASPFFAVNRPAPVAFHERHHGPRTGAPLRPHVDALLAQAGLAPPARIELLCYPTVFGYTFNPLSVFYCHDRDGRLQALIYQVHNTFGETHSYVEPVRDDQLSPAGIRQQRRKRFHVSPFIPMSMTYRFRIRPPGETVSVRILETDMRGPLLAAAFHGSYRPADSAGLLAVVFKTAGITWKVTAGIHFEAARLWLKGLRPLARPAAPQPASYPEPASPGLRTGWTETGRE